MRKSPQLRVELQKIYKQKRSQDQIGRKINDLTQAMHLQFRLPEANRDKELLAKCIEGIKQARKERRFRDDFPSFAKFYQYITDSRNGFELSDVREL